MNETASYQIFKQCIFAIVLWVATLTGCLVIISTWFTKGFEWIEVWPACLLFSMSARYLYVSVGTHNLLRKIQEIEEDET